MTTAWTLGPERGLGGEFEKEDVPAPEDATFHPDLSLSDPNLRHQVHSSNYGEVVPPPKPTFIDDNPDLTFHPLLDELSPNGVQLRKQVPSSKYGRKAAQKKPPPPKNPRPKFKPQVTRTETALKFKKSVPSSGYGRRPASKPKHPEPEVVPREKFKPKLSGSKKAAAMRKEAPSQGYGKSKITSPRKSTNVFQAMDHNEEKPTVAIRRLSSHTLLKDKGDKENDDWEEPNSKEKDFVLDGERTYNHLNPMKGHNLALKYIPTEVVERQLPPSPLKWTARSSGYGPRKVHTYKPPRRELPEKEDEPRWDVTRNKLEELTTEEELERKMQEMSVTRKQLDVQSSGYGKKFPEVKEREEPPPKPQPWLGWTAAPKASKIPEPPEVPVTQKLDVPSAQYGKKSIPPAPRKEVEFAPVWVPSSTKPNIPEPEPILYVEEY